MLSVFITGSNQGLGFEAAKQLSQVTDVHLIISGRRPEAVEEACEKLKESKAKISSVVMDLADDESIKKAAAETEKILDGDALDVLVNNAGIHLDDKDLPTREIFRRTYEINVFGTAIVTETFLPLLKKSTIEGGPRLINVSSGLSSITRMSDTTVQWEDHTKLLTYNSSKTALNSVTNVFRMKYPWLHVILLCPGFSATNLNNFSGRAGKPVDGAKIIVSYALENKGEEFKLYQKDGAYGW